MSPRRSAQPRKKRGDVILSARTHRRRPEDTWIRGRTFERRTAGTSAPFVLSLSVQAANGPGTREPDRRLSVSQNGFGAGSLGQDIAGQDVDHLPVLRLVDPRAHSRTLEGS